jgi:RimJ/RimL family protein N-acetyltransferase
MGMDDVDRIAHWFVDFEDVALFERNLPVPVSPEYVRETWKTALEFADPPRALWFIAEDEDRSPAGVCGLQSINYIHGDAVVPIFVGAKMRGQGLALAISISVIDLAFNRLRLHRLTTFFREDNNATRAITSKVGFVEEGRLRQASFSDGVHKDMIQVGLLKSDWLLLRNSLTEIIEDKHSISINMRHAYE